jgi:tRNA 5-methylaminomethyl-2-thiouridine biosynthesis bifunctional protein
MPEPLRPARLAFDSDGTPYSDAFGDVYHSAAGGPEQARHVFLAGNGLPERWRGRRRFVVLETGFGLGLNFLATWQAWREDARRCERLHFVSIEKHPFAARDLAELHARFPEFTPLAAELHARWPMLVPGAHRVELEAGHVVLTLFFADVGQALRGLRLAADAIYLDGFAPAKNPEMWTGAVMKGLARCAAPGATAATWSAAAPVRGALEAAGFRAEKHPGYAAKREMTIARLDPRGAVGQPAPAWQERRAVVVGAGLAGAAACERLCARGWEVALVEQHAQPALEGSGNHAGVFHPVVTRDDNLLARLSRAGFLAALAHWSRLDAGGLLRWDRCGVLQLARHDREDAAQRAAIASLGYPPEYAQYATRDEACIHAGVAVAAGGLWIPESGWARPASVVEALIDACGTALKSHFGRRAESLAHEAGAWSVRDARGAEIAAAPVVVLANAEQAPALARGAAPPLHRVRGQVSYIPAERIDPPKVVVLRGAIILPAVDGQCVVGASFDLDDPDPTVRLEGHEDNLERLERMLPGAGHGLDPATLGGRVGFRAVARDRLPCIGPLAGGPGLYGDFAYGSRGMLWASLGAELIASELEREPLPLEGALVDALDPGRFARRAARRA